MVPSVSRSAAEPGAKASIVPELTERQFEAKAVEAKRVKRLDLRLPAVRNTRPAASAKPLFVLEMVQVAGATVFSKEAIATSYRPLLRKTVSELDLLNIVESITERYHASGYTLSRAILSPQDIDNGRLRITVLEGRIDDIVIKGNGRSASARDACWSPFSRTARSVSTCSSGTCCSSTTHQVCVSPT